MKNNILLKSMDETIEQFKNISEEELMRKLEATPKGELSMFLEKMNVTTKNKNSIMVIFPYFENGIWAFDDKDKGLQREPFVAGIPEIINLMVANLKEPENGFRLIFSGSSFPNHQSRLKWVREEHGGNWYEFEALKMEGWLCPALFCYFDTAPEFIYFKCESL